ncbi:hypothetical protein IWZ03DRAFT_418732 [Phyllosticta citriasiana]|uniref:F-box domain-containing protein n=1 Tax=Phyllosticta citriasiana TaxID=595635 RepID=A0ABR1K9P4_9PEZI
MKLHEVPLMCFVDQVANCDIEAELEYAQNGYTSTKPVRTLMSLSLVNKELRRIFETVCLLWKRRAYLPFQQHFAAVAQGDNLAISEQIMPLFTHPPVHLFGGLKSLAIHQFRISGYLSDVWISKGIRRLLQAPNALRRLHIDGGTGIANMLEDITLSIEMTFMLEYTLNIQRVSNKAYSGLIFQPRVYPLSHVRLFLAACQRLPRLRILELTVADFDEYQLHDFHNAAIFQIPALSLETFAVTREAARSMEALMQETGEDNMPMGAIINMALSQPSVVELQVPEHGKILLGLSREDEDWDCDFHLRLLTDLLPAAVIAAKVPRIERIKVGRPWMVEIFRDQGQISLKFIPIPDPPRAGPEPDRFSGPILEAGTLPVHIVHGDPEDGCAVFVLGEDRQPTSIEVNLSNEHVDMIEYN